MILIIGFREKEVKVNFYAIYFASVTSFTITRYVNALFPYRNLLLVAKIIFILSDRNNCLTVI